MTSQSGWKLAVAFGFSVLLVFGLLLARAHTASASTGPTITSDKQDYQPGATVTLTGAGWTSGDDIQIYVNDSVGNTWSLTSGQNGAPSDPTVDSNGGFTFQFSLPNSFIANYTATATDKTTGDTATPTFTRTYNWKIAKTVDKTFLDPGGTASYTVTVTETGFTDSTWQVTGNITVTNPNDWESITLTGVTDSIGGTLGSATATDSTPFTSKDFTYTHKFTPPASGCQTVKNCNSGALTIGFWQNKNGQGIISAANQTNLGNWLRGYHPFSDAPSAGLASYVSNIIKVATCTSTNGTATCSGTYEDVSGEFGGATSMTVQAMLVYQNTADPAADAGAVWYGNVKATQVLAKDAFDAIDNQVATAP